MADINRIRLPWRGDSIIGGGVTTLHFSGTDMGGPRAALLDFIEGIRAHIPAGVFIEIPPSGETIDVATGQPNGSWSSGTLTGTVGTADADHAAGVGTRIRWDTSAFTNGRRVRGATFIVPLAADAYDAAGNMDGSALATFQAASTALVTDTSPEFVVFTRPSAEHPVGATAVVTGATVNGKVSWLRSRRT